METQISQSWQRVLDCADELRSTYSLVHGASGPGVALYGAGATGLDAVEYLGKRNIRISCFIDNSPQKQGTLLAGIPVVPVGDPQATSAPLALITTRAEIPQIGRRLTEEGIRSIPFLGFYVLDNLDRYAEVRNRILDDDQSRICLDALLAAMLTGRLRHLAEVMNETPYFCLPHFQDIGEEHFVDAGAYVGDTTELFLWRNTGLFRQIHLFEPGVQQFRALQRRMERLVQEWALDTGRISMVNAGLAEEDGRACFGTTSTKLAATALLDDAACAELPDVELRSIDSYLERKGLPVTFIKSDIEGMEVPMLRGARRSIERFRPKLAISVYHKVWDLFEVIDTVRSYVPEYRFSLRHHSSNLSETVLYGWVEPEQ